jgi:hypothetical protein
MDNTQGQEKAIKVIKADKRIRLACNQNSSNIQKTVCQEGLKFSIKPVIVCFK